MVNLPNSTALPRFSSPGGQLQRFFVTTRPVSNGNRLAADAGPVWEFVLRERNGRLARVEDMQAKERSARRCWTTRPLGEAAASRLREEYTQDVVLPKRADWLGGLLEGMPRMPPPKTGLSPSCA